ncbi:MAG: glycosyltransferase [Polyangiales bacterium]
MAVARASLRDASFPVQLLAGTNVGWVQNCERALAAVQTEWVAFCDQDDVWMPRKLELQAQELERGADMCVTNATIVDAELRPIGTNLSQKELDYVRRRGLLPALFRYNLAQNATIVARTELVRRVMPTPAGVSFDAWVAFALAALSHRVVLLEEPLLLYRQHGANQLGAGRGLGVLGSVRRWRAIAADSRKQRARMADAFEGQRERLLRLGVTADVEGLLRSKSAHLARRASLAADRPAARLAGVAAELLLGRYHAFGRGPKSVVRDLLA